MIMKPVMNYVPWPKSLCASSTRRSLSLLAMTTRRSNVNTNVINFIINQRQNAHCRRCFVALLSDNLTRLQKRSLSSRHNIRATSNRGFANRSFHRIQAQQQLPLCVHSRKNSSSSSIRKQKIIKRKQQGGEQRKTPQTTPNKIANGIKNSSSSSLLLSSISKFISGSRSGGGGGSKSGITILTRDHIIAMIYRLPLWIILTVLLSSDETCPISILHGEGPSMLPTMATSNEIYLIHNLAFYQYIRPFLLFFMLSPPTIEVNDIVVWKKQSEENSATITTKSENNENRHGHQFQSIGDRPLACKRVIGVEGDTVKRYGQYVHLYTKHRTDGGIRWPQMQQSQPQHSSRSDSPNWENETLIVPKHHVWLEGDNPLFSIDSRHIGPIPMNWIRGKVIARIWPLGGGGGNDGDHSHSSRKFNNGGKRPIPHEHIEDYLGPDKGYNLYRVEKKQLQRVEEKES